VGIRLTEIEYTLKIIENLTAWGGVLLQRVIFVQHVKKFPEFDVNRRSIAVSTRSYHKCLF
jgi:hypothetical protein